MRCVVLRLCCLIIKGSSREGRKETGRKGWTERIKEWDER